MNEEKTVTKVAWHLVSGRTGFERAVPRGEFGSVPDEPCERGPLLSKLQSELNSTSRLDLGTVLFLKCLQTEVG